MSASVTVRMYNQRNLGDCFLLKFADGSEESFMLIDFGSYVSGNEKRELEIAKNIVKTVKNSPLTVVLTHQHKDHLSGFISAKAVFDKLNITEVWFSYLDDPNGGEGKKMRDVTEKFWKTNLENKEKAKEKFKGVSVVEKMLEAKEAFDLFAAMQQGGEAISNLLEWSNNHCQFLVPGKNFDLPGLPANTVKVYVLGPPTDPTLLRKLNPGKDDAVHSLNAVMQLSNLDTSSRLVSDALNVIAKKSPLHDEIVNFPFNKKFTCTATGAINFLPLQDAYRSPDNAWRRIDYDWLSEMGRMSLHMDTLTNNSSLVLAFELVKSQKVLLFVGDAQIGNWKSWFSVTFENSPVHAMDLLAKTVLYKAGHHSSHNATLLESLNLMNDKELVIMISVDKKVSDKMGFLMMKPGMLAGYNRQSMGRVLRSDTIFHDAGTTNKFKYNFAAKNSDFNPAIHLEQDATNETHLFIEYTVK